MQCSSSHLLLIGGCFSTKLKLEWEGIQSSSPNYASELPNRKWDEKKLQSNNWLEKGNKLSQKEVLFAGWYWFLFLLLLELKLEKHTWSHNGPNQRVTVDGYLWTHSEWCYKISLLGNFLERGIQYAVEKASTYLTESIKNWQMFMKFAPYLLNMKLKSDELIPWFPTKNLFSPSP